MTQSIFNTNNSIMTGGSITYGQDLYSNSFGSSGLSWHNPSTIVTDSTAGFGYGVTVKSALTVDGDIDCSGDIKHNGKKLSEVLDNIEKRLAILHPNPRLEQEWDELKELREKYVKLEKKLLEKERIWSVLKDVAGPT